MARGGKRQGRAGALYQNRSDLALGPRLPAQAPTGQAYGVAGGQRAAQQAVPLRAVPTAASAQQSTPLAPPPPVPLDAATQHPNEPLTAGAPSGPGPGPEVLGPGMQDGSADELRALYVRFPSNDLRALIEALDGM